MRVNKVKRNAFNLSKTHLTTCDMGQLIPVYNKEVLPGDVFKVNTSELIRLAPMLAPIYHSIDCYIHYFFVPTRLIWKDWENFITGGKDGQDATEAPTIKIPSGGFKTHSLADYFGIPIEKGVGEKISALPFRAYAKIYNEWYMDENLMEEVKWTDSNGDDTITSTELLNRCWKKDRFTSGLPWAQRGKGVSLPLGQKADIYGYSGALANIRETQEGDVGFFKRTWQFHSGSHPFLADGEPELKNGVKGLKADLEGKTHSTSGYIVSNGHKKIDGAYADLSNASSMTVSAFRKALQVQKWMERNARSGYRYIENILSHWGVRSSDARLQRSEYLGGGKMPVIVSEVLQTSSTSGTSPQGNMSGHGFSMSNVQGFVKGFEEHGYIIGLMSVMPRAAYMQGLEKSWTRESRFDYCWPEFQFLSEQPVKNKEIYLQDSSVLVTGSTQDKQNDATFAYSGIYDEYRHDYDTITGDFRTSLNYWHLGRQFDELPTLSDKFVECRPSKRIFAVTDPNVNSIWVNLAFNVKAYRLLAKYAEPSI